MVKRSCQLTIYRCVHRAPRSTARKIVIGAAFQAANAIPIAALGFVGVRGGEHAGVRQREQVRQRMDRLDNPIRDYAWGSADDIPDFLGLPPDGSPQAEMWMGAHPSAPSAVFRGGKATPLPKLIAEDPAAELGPVVLQRYGARLPFLFKILGIAKPLSLQVHPDKRHAEAAYAAEVSSGAAERDYPDDNHKPELPCALRDGFEVLCGFRPVPDTLALLDDLGVPELTAYRQQLAGSPGEDGLRTLVTQILTARSDHAAVIAAVLRSCARLAAGDGRWAAACAAYAGLAAAYPADPGVLVGVLMNHAVLAEGDALFVAAGVPHCYLHGFAAELMASSDNVLRAGLTSKRVNVPELLRVLDFRPAALRVLRPEPEGSEETYPVPVGDFRLSRMQPGADGVKVPGSLPQILLCVAGTVVLGAPGGTELTLHRGQSAYLSARCAGVVATGPGTILRATVGG
jgi:mannose-6-phosphate isomerase